jgi:hypothetical protein
MIVVVGQGDFSQIHWFEITINWNTHIENITKKAISNVWDPFTNVDIQKDDQPSL